MTMPLHNRTALPDARPSGKSERLAPWAAVAYFLFLVIGTPRWAAANHLPDLPDKRLAGDTGLNLDRDLLGGDLLDKLEAAPSREGAVGPKPRKRPEPSTLPPGEDLGAGRQPLDPLKEIGRQMREIERRMVKDAASAATLALQKEVSGELAKLIDQMQQSESNSNKAQKRMQQQGKPKEGANDGGGTETADHAAGESRDRLGSPGENAQKMEDISSLLREAWGQLPERVRGRMQNSSVEQFLPQYDQLIREYFKRLSRENRVFSGN